MGNDCDASKNVIFNMGNNTTECGTCEGSDYFHFTVNQTNFCFKGSCFDYYIKEGSNTCVQNCDKKIYLKNNNLVCGSNCPNGFQFIQKISNNNYCVSNCPTNEPYYYNLFSYNII